jgi:hypothetical protein
VVAPLPPGQQPPQDDPLAGVTLTWAGDGKVVALPDDAAVAAEAVPQPIAWDGIPDVQLYDRTTSQWVELPHPTARREFRIADPERYVDETGAFLVRFVNRGGQDMGTWFVPLVRLEGDAA